jgi:hypothetical protein
MDRELLIDTLGLVPGGGFSVTDIQMGQWGLQMIFAVRYQTASMTAPPDPPVHINLVFNDCREIRYKVYAHIGLHEQGKVTPIADVGEMVLGMDNHRAEAYILTNHFSVMLSYGTLTIERDGQSYHLAF